MSESSQAVFVSYTSRDAEAARRICESLRLCGIEVWLDQSELRGRVHHHASRRDGNLRRV
jgi:hypothetical protein